MHGPGFTPRGAMNRIQVLAVVTCRACHDAPGTQGPLVLCRCGKTAVRCQGGIVLGRGQFMRPRFMRVTAPDHQA